MSQGRERIPCDGAEDPACVERFWALVGPPDEDGCRLWTGAGSRSGSPKFGGGPPRAGGGRRQVYAYRFLWRVATGADLKSNEYARAICGKQCCMVPSHRVSESHGYKALSKIRNRRQRVGVSPARQP